ncbi:MAG: hypothetical protein LBS81_03290 [Endomicrobium sp.]|jgi:ribonucleoside-triphosphate reductase|nr:hypothetical protein [Endomicrobium sp.]
MKSESFLNYIVKRDGSREIFNPKKIAAAIAKVGEATGEFDYKVAGLKTLSFLYDTIEYRNHAVEYVRDIVEEVLLSSIYKKQQKRIFSTVTSTIK